MPKNQSKIFVIFVFFVVKCLNLMSMGWSYSLLRLFAIQAKYYKYFAL